MSLKEKIIDFIGKWIIVTLGILGSAGAFVSMFEIVVNVPVVILTTISVTGIFLAISKLRRKAKVTVMIAVLFVMTVSIIMMRKMLLVGIYSIANAVIDKYNAYFTDGVMGYFEVESRGIEDTLVLVIAVIIYSYILVTATWYKMFASIHILLSVLFVVPGMILGMMPNSLFVSILMIYYMSCFMYQHNKRVYPIRFLALVMVSLVIIGLIFIFSPPSVYDAETKYKDIYKKLNDISRKYNLDDFSMNNMKKVLGENESIANGGINGGKLGDISEVRYLEKTMLKISAPHDDNVVYLKGFVGTEYDKRQWNPISYDNINRYREFCAEMEFAGFNQLYSEGITVSPEPKVFGDREWRAMSVRYIGAEKEYRYLPYFSNILEKSDVSFYYGIRPESNYQEEYDYTYVSLSEADIYASFRPDLQDQFLYDYIKETNLSVPANIRRLFDEKTGLEEDCYDDTVESMIRCINQVRDYLADNTTYTLSPGKLDSGKDYVEDFLTDKKKGYCTAYASSATLMLRYMGIPARYVEGYIVRPSDYHNQQDSSYVSNLYSSELSDIDYMYHQSNLLEADIKDSSAHAWVEVYVQGIGFVPIEMTPGYGVSDGGEDNKDTTKANAQTQEQTTKPDEPKETTTIDESGQTGTSDVKKESSKKVEPGSNGNAEGGSKSDGIRTGTILIILASLIAVAVISLTVYKVSEAGKKKYDYHTSDIRYNITVLGRIFEKCLDRLCIDHSKNVSVRELEKEISGRIDNALAHNKKILRGDSQAKDRISGLRGITEAIEIINKSKYSGEDAEFTDEEFEKVKDYVEEFKKSLQYLKNKV